MIKSKIHQKSSSTVAVNHDNFLTIRSIPGISQIRSKGGENNESLDSLMENVAQLVLKRIDVHPPTLYDNTASIHANKLMTNHKQQNSPCNFYMATLLPSSTQDSSVLFLFGNEASPALQSAQCLKDPNVLNTISKEGYTVYRTYSKNPASSHMLAMPMPSDDDANKNSFCDISSQTSMNMLGFVSIADSTNSCVILLFPDWVLDNVTKFSVAVVGVFLFGIFVQMVSNLRHGVKSNRKSLYEFFRTGLGVSKEYHWQVHTVLLVMMLSIETVNIYFAMLIAMTYNVEIFVSLVGGMMVGFFMVQYVRQSWKEEHGTAEAREQLLPAVADHAVSSNY